MSDLSKIPNSSKHLYNKALALQNKKKYQEAIKIYRILNKKHPDLNLIKIILPELKEVIKENKL
jgi:outer membrane protein assembly factor BamD (BamD/ComL family)